MGIAGAEIALLTTVLIPVDYLDFRKLLSLPPLWTRLVLALIAVSSFAAIAWLLAAGWFSDWISYTDDFKAIGLDYLLASLLAYAVAYRKKLF